MLPLNFRLLLIRFLWLLLLFLICRLLFGWCNPDTYAGNITEILAAGTRYDLTAICILNFPLILIHLLPAATLAKKPLISLVSFLFMVVNSLAVLLNLIDAGWFEFTGRRSTADVFRFFATGDDVSRNLGQYLIDFWYLLLSWIIMALSLVWTDRKLTSLLKRNRDSPKAGKLVYGIAALSTILLGIIGIRGGIQLKPLSVQAAARMVPAPAIPLVLNTPYTIIKTINDKSMRRMDYMPPEQAEAVFNIRQSLGSNYDSIPTNVVLILLESFSAEFIGAYNPQKKSHTPFFDSLMQSGLCWPNCFANGKRSIEGIPAATSALPSLMDEAFISSRFNVNCVNSLASLLGRNGYSSAFFHGGNNGTMGFDNFTRLAGYEQYYGKDEYKGDEEDNDGNWGIFDHAFFRFTAQEIGRMKPPFHATLFSLSSHHPYTIPRAYKQRIPSGLDPVRASIAYTDIALQEFFEIASSQPWFKNTLFVLCADHTGPAQSEYYNRRLGMYKVPLIFYHPGRIRPELKSETAQQCDILPSILDYCGYTGNYVAFGKSLFRNGGRWAINYVNGSWQIIDNKHVLQFDGEQVTGMYNRTDSLLNSNIFNESGKEADSLSNLLKALLVQYSNGLNENRLCP
jgi:phosphoglycerol transferase MdoB-like AlkP superfamily enzyme